MGTAMVENDVAKAIVDAAFHVHLALGPGLFESVYERSLARELELRNISFLRQPAIPVIYKGVECEEAFRADLIVANAVLVEVKAVEKLALVHRTQVLTYLRFTNLRLGLLINFHAPRIKDGIVRVANNLRD